MIRCSYRKKIVKQDVNIKSTGQTRNYFSQWNKCESKDFQDTIIQKIIKILPFPNIDPLKSYDT